MENAANSTQPASPPTRPDQGEKRRVSLALQGGGARGAFTWGVLDRLLEDGRIVIDAISATSAGAMNAAALMAGFSQGGAQAARETLERFWLAASDYGYISPIRRSLADQLAGRWNIDTSPAYLWANLASQAFSPKQKNPFDFNPLRDIVSRTIDIDAVHACSNIRLFVTATNVRAGRPRVFQREEISLDVLLASGCLPDMFEAVKIDGDPYWDGGFMGNPALWPLIHDNQAGDIVFVQIMPMERDGTPRMPAAVSNRMNELAFNSSLMHEMRSLALMQELVEQDALKEPYAERYRNLRLHLIGDEAAIRDLGVSSKFNVERAFLLHLKEAGRACADGWLATTFQDLGKRSSIDVRQRFL